MIRPSFPVALVLALGAVPPLLATDPGLERANWPQFRGPGGNAVGAEGMNYPVKFGKTSGIAWKVDLPPGNSSPCIWDNRIFLTGYLKDKNLLETLCIDRANGKVLWRKTLPAAKFESSIHPSNGPATPTPATDGKRVYVYFGSFGLVAYDFDGKEIWQRPLPMPELMFATGSSPVVAGDLVILAYPGKPAALMALNSSTGATVWKKERPRFRLNYATPMIVDNKGTQEIVLAQSAGVVAYDLKDGSERWWVGGLMGAGIPSPASGHGLIFINAHSPGGDPDEPYKLPKFADLVAKFDKNKDGKLSETELPKEYLLFNRGSDKAVDNIVVEDVFDAWDRNHDKQLTQQEWDQGATALSRRESQLVAIRPVGQKDIGKDQIVWREKRALPEVPSPLYYQGRLYLVKDGGMMSCLDASTGKLVYRKRLGATGIYYASPVAAGNHIYVSSRDGVVAVVEAGDKGEALARNDLGEPIVASPALVDGKLYVRTEGHLFAFQTESTTNGN
jgi:outer membrane protein assembly factor BamB